jgi:hypothetical protein
MSELRNSNAYMQGRQENQLRCNCVCAINYGVVTVREFLKDTSYSDTEIAKECAVDLSQVGRWRSGKTIPRGNAAVKLYLLSGGTIEFPKRRRRKRSAA